MFIDYAKIQIRAGKGGNGAVSFHREKYVAAGGPNGGDGGDGGNVVFEVNTHMATLMDFRYKTKYQAENGQDGMGKNCYGKDGKDLVIRVPKGTLIKDAESGRIIFDLSEEERFIAAKGGNGGHGNSHFATPTRQAPRFAKEGQKGQAREVILELKLIADVGLLGFPNVGKSTLLSTVSAARPKIANYHFTTLTPNLGVVAVDAETSFVMADIPGIVEGAAEGVGLGHAFLRHVERCRLLVHLVDMSGSEDRDPIEDFKIINRELANYSRPLSTLPQILVGNKNDLCSEENVAALKEFAKQENLPFYAISAATKEGVQALVYAIANTLKDLPPVVLFQPEMDLEEEKIVSGEKDYTVKRRDDGAYVIEGSWVDKVAGRVNINDYESLQYLHRVLKKGGVFDRLEAMGIEENAIVSILDVEFEYMR